MTKTDLRARGLRNVEHTFMVAHGVRNIYPFFCAPARPMETIVGFRVALETWLNFMVKAPFAPPVKVEIGVWKVPISTLGDQFTDLFTADYEDEAQSAGTTSTLPGTGLQMPPGTVAGQGPYTPSILHQRARSWAGELGASSEAAVVDASKVYIPFVSAATYHVARSFYEMELQTNLSTLRSNPDLWQNPPRVSRMIRGMTNSGIAANANSDAIPTGGVAEWAERLSLLARPNRTYREYLQAFGVPTSRIPSLPEPLMLKRLTLRKHDPAPVFGSTFAATANEFTNVGGTTKRNTFSEGGLSYSTVMDHNLCSMSLTFDETRKRRIMIDEPSLILGTVVAYDYDSDQSSMAHHMDVNRLISGALWGDPQAQEIDFITSQNLSGAQDQNRGFGVGFPTSSATQAPFLANNDDGQGPPYVMNALNLFLHGDSFTNDAWAFRYLEGGDNVVTPTPPGSLEPGNAKKWTEPARPLTLSTIGSYKMGVATDLVQ